MTGLTYGDLVAMYERLSKPPEPIKLTHEQWEWLKKDTPTVVDVTGTVPLLGVPLHIVDTVQESTPYLEGWDGWPEVLVPPSSASVAPRTEETE